MRDDKPVAVPQAVSSPAPEAKAAEAAPTIDPPVAEAPAEERIVLEAPDAPEASAEPLELTNLFNDELLLQPEAAMPDPAAEKADEDDDGQGNRKWVAEPEPARRPSAAGATLFERMSNIARGAPKAQLDEDEAEGPGFKSEPIDIPRFLNRQNNQ